ncbi:MAG: hypothetical protein LBB11_01260 [Puniceicoccales bacterium]|jgi:hypothetical protein|nr:hypothetical protein [Puniceicoccales bacterium]
MRFSIEIRLTLGHYPCRLLLEQLPPLAVFSDKFAAIDFFSVPEEIRLLVFQGATEALQEHYSAILKTAITIDALEPVVVSETVNGIDFTITGEQNRITAGTLVAPKEVLAMLAKKIQRTPVVHHFRNLEFPYHFSLGSTRFSWDDYEALCEEDVIFLDQHELAKAQKMAILDFGDVRVRGNLIPSGVVVQQIQG